MKIKEIMDRNLSAPDLKKLKNNEGTRGLDFLNSLKKANADLGNLHRTTSFNPFPAENVFPPNSSLSVQPLIFPSPGENRTIHPQTLHTTKRTLDILEEYQKALSDPGISLKKIDPMIQLLSKEMEGLTAMSAKLPPTDPLQNIINEVGVLSAVEIQKFKRGDYI